MPSQAPLRTSPRVAAGRRGRRRLRYRSCMLTVIRRFFALRPEPSLPDSEQVQGRGEARYELVYKEALRAIQEQQRSLDELRQRAGILVAAAPVAASLLGGDTLKDGVNSTMELMALAALGSGTFLALLVLRPVGGWHFYFGTKKLLDDYVEADPPRSIDDLYRSLAVYHERNHDNNAKRLGKLYWLFTGAAFLLLLQVAAWLGALALGTLQ